MEGKNDGPSEKRVPRSPRLSESGMSDLDPSEVERIKLLQKLNLAHEIGLDQSFSLKKEEPPDNSIEKVVSEVLHSAFWDIFEQQISSDPPNLDMALKLIKEIKEGLYDVMMPHQEKLKNEVDVTLDLDLIQSQAMNNALDVMYFAQFVISVMKKLCAPVRDEQIAALSKETNIVALFRGILETLKLMKIDLANFTLFSIRPELVSNNMKYERQKFADYIKLSGDKLPITEAWLKKHMKTGVNQNINDLLYEAFLDLLVWDINEPYPETLILDENRLVELKDRFYSLTVTASIVLLSFNSLPPNLQSDTSFKEKLKEHIKLLLEGVTEDDSLAKCMGNVVEQLKKDINDALSSRELGQMSEAQSQALRDQVEPVSEKSHRVRQLVIFRVLDYLKLTLKHPGGRTNFPPALLLFKSELQVLCNTFMNIVLYNINICFEHYKGIFNANDSPSSSSG